MVLPRAARAERTSADPRSSTLEPHEYFVLSCVDGKLTVEQIVASTGLGAQAERALERLVNEGLLRVVANATNGSGPSAAATNSLRMQAEQRRQAMLRNRLASMTPSAGTSTQDVVRATAQARAADPSRASSPDAGSKRPVSEPVAAAAPPAAPHKPTYEPVIELVAATDARLRPNHPVPLELQRRALWLSDQGADLDPFTMLEVHPTADPAQIRRAFHLVSRKFHPDTYYKQDLGSFGPLLDRLFQRARTSYEALKDDKLRDEWRRSLWTEPAPEPAVPIALAGDADSVAIRVDAAAIESGPHAASNGASKTSEAPPDPAEIARQAEEMQRARDERAARDRARAQAQQDRMGDRGRQVEQQARRLKALEHVEQADLEIEAGRWAAAAAALRLAVAATPEDQALVRRAEEARLTAREKRKEELYRILRGGLGSPDAASNDPWKRTAMWRELADLDPTPETLSRAADMARDRDPVESRAWILRALGMLGAGTDDANAQKERERGQVHLRAARVFFSIGQPHTAEQELKLAELSLGGEHDDVKSTRSLLRSSTTG